MKVNRAALLLFGISVIPYVFMYGMWTTSHLFLPDDAYYYFKIAYNIHAGAGSTFDGINATNGYHPLWILLLSLFATPLFSKDLFAGIVLLLQCSFVAFAWAGLYGLLYPRRDRKTLSMAVIISALLMFNYYISKIVINGMESALFFLLQALLIGYFSRWLTDGRGMGLRRAGLLGALAALMILSRLDSFYYVAVISVVWILKEPRAYKANIGRILLFMAIPSAVLLAYMAINQELFGIWMPVSGWLKRNFYVSELHPLTVIEFFCFAVFMLFCVRILAGPVRKLFTSPKKVALVTVSLFLIVFEADSTFMSGHIIPPLWYMAPHLTWLFLACMTGAERLMNMQGRILKTAVIGSAAAIWMVSIALTWGIRLQDNSYNIYVAAHEAAQWIDENLPEDALLAGWDVGIQGYYSDASIMNLDGLVNSYEFARHLTQGRALQFLDNSEVSYIVQYYDPGFIRWGYDLEELRKRLGRVLWSREVKFASMYEFMRTGRRKEIRFHYMIHEYRGKP